MNESDLPTSSWRTAKLRLLMTAVCIVCLAVAIIVAFQFILPTFGIDPKYGASPIEEPLKATLVVCSVVLPLTAILYGGAIFGAWIAKRYFPLNDVEAEFLWLLWLPGMRTANTRLFRCLFSRRADV